MVDKNYQVLINGNDYSDIISMDNGYQWTVNSFSADSATGQDTDGNFHVPILGERVQLKFTCPPYITKVRLSQLVIDLEMGSKGQREISIKYEDPLFGVGTWKFYCTNIPWIKAKLPSYPYHYGADVSFQLTSSNFVGSKVVNSTKVYAANNVDPDYLFKINGKDFSDVISIDGYKGQIIDQSLESETGLTLDGKFHLPIIGSRTQIAIDAIEYLEIDRLRQLGKELGFGITGERSHMVSYVDMVMGQTNQKFYCTELTGYVAKLPIYPYHYIKDVKFQQAMKQFY